VAPRSHPVAGVHGRGARLGRRQSVHLPRYRAGAIAWMAAEADDPRRHHQDAGLPPGESLAAGRSRMKVCVSGLWHLGTVTAACLASAGHDVIGLDPDATVVDRLNRGTPPLFEPGLENMVKQGLDGGRLRFTTDTADAVRDADVVWVTVDTP